MSYLFGGVLKSTVTLLTADILALDTTPFTIVPAPPTGFGILVNQVQLEYIAGTQPFTVTGGGYLVQYSNTHNPSPGLDGGYMASSILTLPFNQFGILGPPMYFGASFNGGVQPVGSFGPTDNSGITNNLTQVQNNGPTATYFGDFTLVNGNVHDGALNGYWVTIAGFTNSANNGTFLVDSATNSTYASIEVVNASAVNETHAGTAVFQNKIKAAAIQLGLFRTTDNPAFSGSYNVGGGLLTATVTAGQGGTGYTPGDTGTVGPGSGGGSGAKYSVTTAPGGVVSAVSITQAGNLFLDGETGIPTTVLTGGGSGTLQLDVASTRKGNGSLKVTTYYQLIPLS